jgi:hypothetical protein
MLRLRRIATVAVSALAVTGCATTMNVSSHVSLDGVVDNQEWMEKRIDDAVARILAKLPRRLQVG